MTHCRRLRAVSEPPADQPGADNTDTSSSSGAGHTAAPDVEAKTPVSRIDRRNAIRALGSRRRRRIALVTVGIFAGLVVLIVAAGAAFLWYESNRIHRVEVKHLATVASRGSQKDVQNILLIGSTTRRGLKEQSTAFGLCDQGVTGVNSD